MKIYYNQIKFKYNSNSSFNYLLNLQKMKHLIMLKKSNKEIKLFKNKSNN